MNVLDAMFMVSLTGVKSTRKKLDKMKDMQVNYNVFFRLFNEAMKAYKFEGLPDTVSERVIIQSLICYGSVVFFEKQGQLLALPGVPSGKGWNIYGDPLSAWIYSKNGIFNEEINLHVQGGTDSTELRKSNGGGTVGDGKGVIIWENKARYPFINTIFEYADNIADTMITINEARIWLKNPWLPVCSEDQVYSVQKVFDKIRNNERMIPVSGGITDLRTFDLKDLSIKPETITNCISTVEWYEARFREMLGIDSNSQVDKKGENLTEDEIHVNNMYTEFNALTDYINEQLELVNKVYGTNIKCVAARKDMQSESFEGKGDTYNVDDGREKTNNV